MSPDADRQRLIQFLVRWLLSLAEQRPLGLVVEDLHWADPSSLETLGELAQPRSGEPIFVLLTSRPEFAVPWQAHSHSSQIALGRLNAAQTRALIVARLRDREIAEPEIDELITSSDGVPLFAEELASARASQPDDARAHDIPLTLYDSLMSRLDRMGTAKAIAQIASVVGSRFLVVAAWPPQRLAAACARPRRSRLDQR